MTIATCTLVLTALLHVNAVKLERVYLDHFPRFYDALSYDSLNANLFLASKNENRFELALHELQTNNRHIFRTLPLILFAPTLLASPFGHLATSLPLIFSFGFLLALECYRKFRSAALSLLSLVSLFTLPGLINPTLGFGANWLDMPASMAMGTSVLALLRFSQSGCLYWLAVFGIFASITATCRWSSAPYLAFYCAPVVLISLFRYLRRKGTISTALQVIAATAGGGAFFFLYNAPSTYWYYSNVCFGMGSTIAAATDCTIQGLLLLMYPPLVLVILIMLGASFYNLVVRKPAVYEVIDYCSNLWFPVSITLLLCLILKSSQAIHPMVYLIPALLVSAFTANVRRKLPIKPLPDFISIAIIFFLVYQYYGAYHTFLRMAKSPPAAIVATKRLDQTLAHYLGEHKVYMYAEFDDERSMAVMDCFYESGWKPHCRQESFSVHESYFKAWHPGESPLQVAEKIFAIDEAKVDVVLVHESAKDVLANPLIDNNYSRAVSLYMTEHTSQSSHWRKVAVWQGPHGPLGVYENLLRLKKNG